MDTSTLSTAESVMASQPRDRREKAAATLTLSNKGEQDLSYSLATISGKFQSNKSRLKRDSVGKEVLLVPAVIINLKDVPVMNGIRYLVRCIDAMDWNCTRVTNGHPYDPICNASSTMGAVKGAQYKEGKLEVMFELDPELCERNGCLDKYTALQDGSEEYDVSIVIMIKESNSNTGEVDGVRYYLEILDIEPISVGILSDDGACGSPYCGTNSNIISNKQEGSGMSENVKDKAACDCGSETIKAMQKLRDSIPELVSNHIDKREADVQASAQAKSDLRDTIKSVAKEVVLEMSGEDVPEGTSDSDAVDVSISNKFGGVK